MGPKCIYFDRACGLQHALQLYVILGIFFIFSLFFSLIHNKYLLIIVAIWKSTFFVQIICKLYILFQCHIIQLILYVNNWHIISHQPLKQIHWNNFLFMKLLHRKAGTVYIKKEMSHKWLMNFASRDDKVGSTPKIHTH